MAEQKPAFSPQIPANARAVACAQLLSAQARHCDCRLIEDADLRSTQDLFGSPEISLEEFTPKSAKDFEQFGRAVAVKYLLPHLKSSHYKTLLKILLKEGLAASEVQQVKDLETSLAGIRSDKIKEEKAKQVTNKGVVHHLSSLLHRSSQLSCNLWCLVA